MYGEVRNDVRKLKQNPPRSFSPGWEKLKNKYADESEIIVEPHEGTRLSHQELSPPPTLMDKLSQRRNEVQQKKAKSALDYFFSKFKKNEDSSAQDPWRRNTDQEAENEYNWEYKNHWNHTNLFPTVDHFKNALNSSKTVEITPEMDQSIANRSRTQSLGELKELTSGYRFPRDVDRIVQGLNSNKSCPCQ